MIIKSLFFSYESLRVFDSFSFDSKSPLIVLTGPSGCGKTTLLKLISGNLIPDKCEYLKVYSNVYFIIQEDALLPWLSGYENLVCFSGLKKDEKVLKRVCSHGADFIKRKACDMSYGQRRMIELFRAFLGRPKLLLLDEPFNFMDDRNRAFFSHEIELLISEGTKVIMATHYSEDFSYLNPDIYVFDGRFPVRCLKKNNANQKI